MVVELRRTYKHVLMIFVCTGDLLLVFISISQEREEDLCKFWAYVLMLSLPVSSLPSWNLCHCVLQRSRYLPNSQVLQVQVGWKRGIVIALPEGQSYRMWQNGCESSFGNKFANCGKYCCWCCWTRRHNPMDFWYTKLWYLVTILLLLCDCSVLVETK